MSGVLLTVPEAARRLRKNPETIRRWIREGKLASEKVGTQHLVGEDDLARVADAPEMLPLPPAWRRTASGLQMPNVVAALQRSRGGH
jgi:excisionase family DNA binding protein